MPSATTEGPPVFRAYGQPGFLRLIEDVYDLKRICLAGLAGGTPPPPLFCSAKPFKGSDVFLLPFQYYRSLDLGRQEDVETFFSSLQSWSEKHGRNVSLQMLERFARDKVAVTGRNPILHLPADQEAAWEAYSRNLRTNLKRNRNKARRIGVLITQSRDEADLKAFYRAVLAKQYVTKHRMVFQPYSLFQGLWRLGMLQLIVARMGPRIVGGLILVKDEGGIHYSWGASETPGQLALGTLMLHHAIKHAITERLRWFDFGSTPLSDTQLLNFKLRWGCSNYPVFRHYTLRPPPLTDLNSSFLLARRVFSHVPVSFARVLMPRVVPWLVR